MTQEARNTERHINGWGATRLRDTTVSFVSAGHLVREEPQSSSQEDEVPKTALTEDEKDVTQDDAETGQSSPPVIEAEKAVEVAVVPAVSAATTTPSVPFGDDRHSSSSDDEVIFLGRNTPVAQKKPQPQSKQSTTIQQPTPVSIPQPPKVLTEPPVSASSDASPAPGPLASSAERPRRRWETRWERRRREEQEEEDALMEDYIANMAVDDDEEDEEEEEEASKSTAKPHRRNEHFRFHRGDGEADQKVKLVSTSQTQHVNVQTENNDWDSADLDDLNDLSTTDEDVPDVGRVLRHRERPGGKQYLVTATGMEVGDAKWVAHSKLVSTTAVDQIQIYEMRLEARLDSSVEESSDEDEEVEDLIDDIGSEQDENERIIERTSRMTDEQIARALAKQEELGMGGDELLLFDGADGDDLDDENDMTIDEFMSADSFIPFSPSKHTSNRGRSKRNRRCRDSFPSAGAFADALDQDPYGGFDVMDFDRPSLRPKRKGRKSDFPYDLDDVDDELAEQLMNTWTKDREKKAARKREKMEEHEAFLLETAAGSDPAVIKARIRQFLVSEAETLELTSMEAGVRAGVHRLAKALRLNSRSQGKEGKGAGRYPVLTKTPYTTAFTVDTIWEVDALLNQRKFFPKIHYKAAKAARPSGFSSRHDRGGVAAASYANGEVVGAAAPEIGIENRGRAMLEKMGWSVGMGIGAVGNKGSIDSVKHVVKTNKAGLG